jgi:hypothetical protein
MRFQHVPELVHVNFIPGQQVSIRCEESGAMVHPMNVRESFSAIDAIFVAIPSH